MEEWIDRVSGIVKEKYEWFEPEKIVIEHLKEYRNILEIGSGLGRYTSLIPWVVGLEYSNHFINYCKKNVKGIFLRADGFNIPIKDNVFECVFSSGVIEHFDNPEKLVKEHVRVCKTGGVVIITVPARDSFDYRRFELWRKHLATEKEADWHYHGRRITDGEIYELLKRAGLDNIEIFHVGVPLRGSIFGSLSFLKTFPSNPSIDLFRGAIFEGAGFMISTKPFRTITGDGVLKKYMKTHGYYLFSISEKVGGLKNQATDIRIREYKDLYSVLECPHCNNGLHREGDFLLCEACGLSYPLREGIPFLTREDAIERKNR